MRVEIFDVGHGHCSVVTAPNGKRIMLDCGFGGDSGWFPSVEFSGQFLDLIAILNLDEDHVDDLPYILKSVRVGAFFSNPTINADALAEMKRKTGGMNPGVAAAHSILATYGQAVVGQVPIDTGEVSAWTHYNRYGFDFTDTNNLSLAVFVEYAGVRLLFCGDLEVGGWRRLLCRPEFRHDLTKVNVLIAAHHGRESGICDEVFEFCRPEIVIISDKGKLYDSQETHSRFYHRTSGIPVMDVSTFKMVGQRRHVYTTRSDGRVTIDVSRQGRYLVTPEMVPRIPLPSSIPNIAQYIR